MGTSIGRNQLSGFQQHHFPVGGRLGQYLLWAAHALQLSYEYACVCLPAVSCSGSGDDMGGNSILKPGIKTITSISVSQPNAGLLTDHRLTIDTELSIQRNRDYIRPHDQQRQWACQFLGTMVCTQFGYGLEHPLHF